MRYAAILLAAAALVPAPALAQRSISASDKAQGDQANPQLLAQFGGKYAGPQVAFVDRVGKRVAVESGLSNATGDFTIALLNSPVENAFAIPGGYVYVTRQLLALMNSEDELAFVLGHEVGHVAARHSNKRQTRSTIASVLAAGLGALSGSDLVGRIAGTGSQLYTLGFSRSQEYEADSLGLRYITSSGYTPFAAPTMLAQLNAETTLDARIAGRDANAVPSWMSTHPNGADRVARARGLAQQSGRRPPAAGQDTAFLRMLDGMRYDEDPNEGVIDGQNFRHPGLRIRFTAPAGYTIANASDVVTVQGNGGAAQFRAAAATSDLPGFLRARLKDMGGTTERQVETGTTADGRARAITGVRATANGKPVDVTLVAYGYPSQTYWFTLVTPAGSEIGPFQPLLDSLRGLSSTEAATIKGKRIRIVTVKAGDTVESLAAQMAYPTYRRERFMTLNALGEGSALRAGSLVKLVVEG